MRGKIGVVPQEPMYKVPEGGMQYGPPGLGKLPPGSSLPVRNSPFAFVPDEERQPPPHFLEWAQARLLRHADRLVAFLNDYTRIVEEYAGESTESASGETTLSVIADYSPASELITQALVVGPPSTSFTLQLGSRYIPGVTDVSGKYLLTPVMFKLKPDDQRILTAGSGPSAQAIVTAGTLTGTTWTWVNNTGGPVTLTSLRTILTTDATVANRFIQLQIRDASGNVLASPTNTSAVLASSSIEVSFYQGASNAFSPSGNAFIALPDVQVPAGGSVFLTVSGLDAGDTLSANVLSYEGASSGAGNWMLHLAGRVISNRSYT